MFTWDYENRLVTATSLKQGQGDSATYGYDALGRRVKKAVTTGTTTVPTYFVNAGAQEIVALTGDATTFNDPAADPEDAWIAPFDPATGAGARGSLLADPAAQRFNFQPASTDTPDGWLADTGALRASPTTRGWTSAATGTDRDLLGRPLYDSFIALGTSTWQVPVANGTHAVVIMCGDAGSRAQTNHLTVNGVAVVDPTPYDGLVTNGYETGSFDGYALTVNVTNGLLTIRAGAGALAPKIDFVEIGAAGSAADPATVARVKAAAEKATKDTANPKPKTPPTVKRNVWGDYVDELLGYSIQKLRHATVRYWVSSNHLYSPSAVTNSAGQVVSRYSYDAYGRQTIRNAAGAVVATSDPAGLGRGFTGYRTDSESGLYYARERMYSSKQGKFSERDSCSSKAGHNKRSFSSSVQINPAAKDGYNDGINLYSAYFIPNKLDPYGLETYTQPSPPCGEMSMTISWNYGQPFMRADFNQSSPGCCCMTIQAAQWINQGSGFESDNPLNGQGSWYSWNPTTHQNAHAGHDGDLGGEGSVSDGFRRSGRTWWLTCFYCIKPSGRRVQLACMMWYFHRDEGVPSFGRGTGPNIPPGPMANVDDPDRHVGR